MIKQIFDKIKNIETIYINSGKSFKDFQNNYNASLDPFIAVKKHHQYKLSPKDKRMALNKSQWIIFKFLCSVDKPIFYSQLSLLSYLKLHYRTVQSELTNLEKMGYISVDQMEKKIYYYCYDQYGGVINAPKNK